MAHGGSPGRSGPPGRCATTVSSSATAGRQHGRRTTSLGLRSLELDDRAAHFAAPPRRQKTFQRKRRLRRRLLRRVQQRPVSRSRVFRNYVFLFFVTHVF